MVGVLVNRALISAAVRLEGIMNPYNVIVANYIGEAQFSRPERASIIIIVYIMAGIDIRPVDRMLPAISMCAVHEGMMTTKN